MADTGPSRDLEVEIRVQPRASRDRIGGFRDGDAALRIYVSAAPERGKANASVLRLVAKTLGIARSRVGLIRGETSRTKRLRIAGLSEDAFRERMRGQSRS